MNPCVGILRHECLIVSCLVRIVSNPGASCHLGHCSVACRTKQCRAKYWIASSLSSDDTRSLQAIHICIIIFGEAHSVSHSSSYTARYSSSSPTVGRRLGDFQELTSSRFFFFWNCHLILIWWIWISLSAGYPRGFPIRVLCSGKEPYFIHGIDCWGCFPEHMRTVDISRHMRTVPFFLFWDRIVGSYTHYVVSLQDPLFSYLIMWLLIHDHIRDISLLTLIRRAAYIYIFRAVSRWYTIPIHGW